MDFRGILKVFFKRKKIYINLLLKVFVKIFKREYGEVGGGE